MGSDDPWSESWGNEMLTRVGRSLTIYEIQSLLPQSTVVALGTIPECEFVGLLDWINLTAPTTLEMGGFGIPVEIAAFSDCGSDDDHPSNSGKRVSTVVILDRDPLVRRSK